MSKSPASQSPVPALPLKSVAAAAGRFVADLRAHAPYRVEARVSSHDGMPLLCVVEAVLGQSRPRPAAQELVWLNAAAQSDAHRLELQAFGPDNKLLAQASYEFRA